MSVLKARSNSFFASLICVLLYVSVLNGQVIVDRSSYEQVLVPLSTSFINGAQGSIWFSDLRVVNATNERVEIYWHACTVVSCERTIRLEPTETKPAPVIRTGDLSPFGVLLWIPKSAAAGVRFHSRIFDLSRDSKNYGTEIPVVREADFLSGRAQLVHVPLDARFRQSLRIYDVDNHPAASFRVRFFSEDGSLLTEATVGTIQAATGPHGTTNIPPLAPVAVINGLSERFPQIGAREFVRIEVEPIDGQFRFWAFVSITNNDTQHVTTITPQ